MAYYDNALVSAAPSATSIGKRTVSDTIRHLFPGFPTMSLVQSGAVGDAVTKTRGIIGKESVDNTKFEAFNYSPAAILHTCSTYTSATSLTFSSSDGLSLKMVLLNTRTRTLCRIGALNTTTNVATVTSVGGTTHSGQSNDTYLALAPDYEENSSSPYIIMKDEDNLYNTTQINRFPSAISASNKGNPFYGKDYWARVRKQVVMEGMRKVENAALWSDRPSGTGITTTDGTLADSFGSTRGLWKWAVGGGANFNAQGSMTHEKFVRDLPLAMNDTVGSQDKIILYCGRSQYADMVMWCNQNLMTMEQGTLKKFGVKSKVFVTSGPEIEAVVHDSMNRGSLNTVAIAFNPEYVKYCFKKGRDFRPKLGIQNNDVDGVEDDFIGEWGLKVEDGGNAMTYIQNW
jgi:hypothetical protein